MNMEKNRKPLFIAASIIVLFIIVLALLARISSQDVVHDRSARRPLAPATPSATPMDREWMRELIAPSNPHADRYPMSSMTPAQRRVYESRLARQNPSVKNLNQPYEVSSRPLAGPQYVSNAASRVSASRRPGATRRPSARTQSGPRSGSLNTSGENTAPISQRAQNRMNEYERARQTERERIIAPFRSRTDRAQDERLKRQLDNVSSGIDRAIAQATLPKSKQQQNVEKYLAQRDGRPVAQNQFNTVAEQVAQQKAGVVKSVTDSFGSAAGRKAAGIMDNFQKEMTDAANDKELSPRQKEKKMREVNQKYNKELQDLTAEENQNKFEEDQRKDNAAYVADIRAKFGDKTAAQAQAKLDEYTQEKMKLISENNSEEKLYEALLPLERKKDEELKNIILENNPDDPEAMKKYNEIQAQRHKEAIEQQRQEMQARGEQPRAYRPNPETIKQYAKDLEAEKKRILDSYREAYGDEAAAQAEAVLNKNSQEQLKALQSGEDVNTVNEMRQKLTEETNKSLTQIRQAPQAQEKLKERYEQAFKQEEEKRLTEMMQSDEISKLSEQDRARVEEQLRPIMQSRAADMAQLQTVAKTQEELEKGREEIQRKYEKIFGNLSQGKATAPGAVSEDPQARERQAVQIGQNVRQQSVKIMDNVMEQVKDLPRSAQNAVRDQAGQIMEEHAKGMEALARTAASQEEFDAGAEKLQTVTNQKLSGIKIPQQ